MFHASSSSHDSLTISRSERMLAADDPSSPRGREQSEGKVLMLLQFWEEKS